MKQQYQLFSGKDGEVLPLSPSREESQLRDFVARHLQMLFGTILIGTEYQVPKKKRIDVVGLTEDGRPVLIECKKHTGKGIVDQITNYYRLLRSHPEFVELAVQHKGRNLNLDKPRLICLAESFTDDQLGAYDERADARERLIATTEFVAHRWFANDIMLLDWVRGTPAGAAPKENGGKRPRVDSSLKYILSVCREGPLGFFNDLNACIIGLGKDVVGQDSKHLRRFYRNGKIFAYLRPVPKLSQMCIWLKLNPQEENPPGKKHVEWMRDVSKIGKLPPSGFDLEIKIKNNPSQRERAKELIQKAYDQAKR